MAATIFSPAIAVDGERIYNQSRVEPGNRDDDEKELLDDQYPSTDSESLPLYAPRYADATWSSNDNDNNVRPTSSTSSLPSTLHVPDFVPAWEGLRGVAVCMTCLSHIHTWSEFMNDVSGHGGVAIFFVLSGFLITGVLVKQQMAKQVAGERFHYRHIARFYMDRNVRLYPALVTLVVVTGTMQIKFNDGVVPDGFGWEALRALFYISNIDVGPSWKSIWVNTWSLGVEEQFYILWSLLLPLLLVLRPRSRQAVVVSLLLFSFSFSYLDAADIHPFPAYIQGFKSPVSNFWKMYAGALLRLSPSVPRWMTYRATTWCALLGIATLCYWATLQHPPDLSLLGFSAQYLGGKVWHEPLMTIFAACIIVGTLHNGNALLETDLLRFIGRISYSLYLYQVPLILLVGFIRGYHGLALTALAAVFATLSTLYIEEPIRQRYRKWRRGGGHS